MTRPRAVPILAALISASLSSGLTAVYLRSREPETVAQRPPFTVTPEQRDLTALLLHPGAPFVAVSNGQPVAAAEGLQRIGFRRGWTRSWQSPANEHLDAVVLEFGAESGARDYARGVGHAATLLVAPRAFTVTGVPGSSGLASTAKDRTGRYAQVVVLTRGVRAVLLVLDALAAAPSGVLVALAQREFAALGT